MRHSWNCSSFLFMVWSLTLSAAACAAMTSVLPLPWASVAYAQNETSGEAPAEAPSAAPADAQPEPVSEGPASVPSNGAPASPPEATPGAVAPGTAPAPRPTARPRKGTGKKPVAGTPAATPAGTPAPKGAEQPAAAAPSTDTPAEEAKPTAEQVANAWHDKTPPSLARRLFLGGTLGLGVGTSPDAGYSSDRLGAQLFSQFVLSAPTTANPVSALRWVLEAQYAGTTGVNVDDDESLSTQAFLVGGGVDYPLGSGVGSGAGSAPPPMTSKERMRVQAIGLVGVSKTMRMSLETGGRPASKYGANMSVDVRYLHLVSDRIEACVGLGARAVGSSWYALNVGLVGSF